MTINLSNIKKSRIYILISLLTFIIYWNGVNNEYSMDDNLVTENVAKVEKGIKGIPEIFKTHYASGKQSYGYRPMVQLTFAIEKQLFKSLPTKQTIKEKKRKDKLTQANVSHFVNILIYALICIVLYSLLAKLFDNYNLLLPLTITILFLVHPLHTEVVDNIKSRDELLMLLAMLFSLKFYLKYAISNHWKYLVIACFCVLIAMLSKRNAMALIGIVPVLLYFKKVDFKKIGVATISVMVIVACFTLIKKGLLTEASTRNLKYFENPLNFEGGIINKITIGLYSAWFYLEMLIFPYELSYYYGYNKIPIATWSHWQVWLSFLFYVPLGIFGFWKFLKRDIIGLGIVLWIGVMLGVINVVFPIVGIVADRFAFTFSLGFCILIGYLLLKLFKIDLSMELYKIKLPNGFLFTISFILVLYSARTIARNPDWHDHMTLYNNDIEHLQESAKAHALLANTYYPILMKEAQKNNGIPQSTANVEKLIYHYKEAIRIDPTYATSLNNLGSVYLNFNKDYGNAIIYCEKAIELDSNYVEAHFNSAYSHHTLGNYDETIEHIKRIIEIKPDYLQIYDMLYRILGEFNKIDEGIEMLEMLALKSDSPKTIYVNLGNLVSSKGEGNYAEALEYFVQAFEYDRSDKKLCSHIIKLSNRLGKVELAKQYGQYCN